MSAADFLLAPEVQKLLKVVFADPAARLSVSVLAKTTKLSEEDVERTLAHLIESGILVQHPSQADEPETVSANLSFVFYNELRAIALKSFAAAEPLRAMLRSKFKDSVLRAFVLGEDQAATIEVLVVHGQLIPDAADMSAACKKVSASIGRHLEVHVISDLQHAALTPRDELGRKLAAVTAIEIIGKGDTKAKPSLERGGLFRSAKEKIAALAHRR